MIDDDSKVSFKRIGEILKSTDDKVTADHKMRAIRGGLEVAKKAGMSPEDLKSLKGTMMLKIKEANRLKSGVISAGGKLGDVLKSGSKKFGKGIPGVGLMLAAGTALLDSPSAAASELVDGAVDSVIPGGIGSLGPKKGSIEYDAENEANPEKRANIMRKMQESSPQMQESMQMGYNANADKATLTDDTKNNPLLNEEAAKRDARKNALMSLKKQRLM